MVLYLHLNKPGARTVIRVDGKIDVGVTCVKIHGVVGWKESGSSIHCATGMNEFLSRT